MSFQSIIEARQRMLIREGLANSVFISDKDVQDFEKNLKSGRLEQKKMSELLLVIYDKYSNLFEKTKKDFETFVKKEIKKVPNVKFLSDIKSAESLNDKAIKRKKGILKINDIVRGALLFDFKEQADEFVSDFSRKNKSIIVEFETKERGQENTYGYYGSHHLALNINGIIVELQVMTKKLWAYKAEAHKIYAQSRSSEDGLTPMRQHDSKKFFSMGNVSKYRKESYEENQEDEYAPQFTIEELEEMKFDTWAEVV